MADICIGDGKLDGKGVYAGRDFFVGEKVMNWRLKPLSQAEFDLLETTEQKYVHSFWGKMYLFGIPSRYTNHSSDPNTQADFKLACDFAIRDIKKGEMITTNATKEVLFELKTFVASYENESIGDFKKIKGGYRNATVSYKLNGNKKVLSLNRQEGNWRIVKTK